VSSVVEVGLSIATTEFRIAIALLVVLAGVSQCRLVGHIGKQVIAASSQGIAIAKSV
jgi:hypothetical protein